MTRDMLDDLLEGSAPPTRSASEVEIEAMITDARRYGSRTRRRRLALTSGALAIVLAGSTGVAAATGGFTWAPWVQAPIGALSFTMVNGFECELRFSEYKGGSDPAFLVDVNRALEDWYRSTDVVAEVLPLLPAQREHVAAMASLSEDNPGADDMSMLSSEEQVDEIEHRAWSREWLAWDLTVSDLETQALRDAGFSIPDERFVGSERIGQIRCFDENHELYAPGAGS